MNKILSTLRMFWHKFLQTGNYDIYSYDDFCLGQVIALLQLLNDKGYKLRIITSPTKLIYKIRFLFDGGKAYYWFVAPEGKFSEYAFKYMEEDLLGALRLKPDPLKFTKKYGINTFIFDKDFDKAFGAYDYSSLDVMFDNDKYAVCVPPGGLENEN